MGTLSGYLSGADRYNLARNAGFNSSDAITMAAISLLECGNCDMSAVNKSGDSSLWQINAIHGYSVSWLSDPVNSAAAAYSVWKSQGFFGWCTYPGGCGGASTITWPQFNAAVQQVKNSLATQGVGGTIPSAPAGTDGTSDSGQISAGNESGSTGQTGGGTTTGTSTGSTAPAGGVQLATVAGFPVNIPSGLVLSVIGVILLIIGGVFLLSQSNVGQRAQTISTNRAAGALVTAVSA